MDPTWERGDDPVAAAAARLADAGRIVVFTGAGVSTDSGIPDFRSPEGIWRRYDPRQFTYQRYLSDPEARRQSWRLRREFQAMRPLPNPAHLACARLAEAGRLEGVVTQNIDGLHGDAGLAPELICELHGNGRWVACLSCGDRMPMGAAVARVDAGEEDSACQQCGGILKATTVSFGQSLPPAAWARAEPMTSNCDAFLAVGSSLVIQFEASCPPSLLADAAARAGVDLEVIATDRDQQVPGDLDDAAGLVLLGGSMDVSDAPDHPALGAAMALIRLAAAQDIPALGICLGGQLAAHALGGRAYRSSRGPEYGWIPLAFTRSGRADPVLGALDSRSDEHT